MKLHLLEGMETAQLWIIGCISSKAVFCHAIVLQFIDNCMKILLKHFLVLLLVLISRIYCQEGMWLPSQICQLNLQKKGLQIPVSKIYNKKQTSLSDAVVQIGGGTGSFVSPEGLLLTNHHVAYTSLQRISSVEHDYLTNGYLAESVHKDIPAPGLTARLLLDMKEVTRDLKSVTDTVPDVIEREFVLNNAIAELTKLYEADAEDIEAEIVPMYEGNRYFLNVYKVFKDIRVVYAPPHAVGNFGGEVDNWVWPRHTGDFTYMRVYCSPDGKGTSFDSANIPYRPDVWLKTASGGLHEGDFTFILGYPGSTTRYRTSVSALWNLETHLPASVAIDSAIIAIADSVSKDNPDYLLKTADLKNELWNTLKNSRGTLEAMQKAGFIEERKRFEADFMEWVNKDSNRIRQYGGLIDREKELYAKMSKTANKRDMLALLQNYGGIRLMVACLVQFIAYEKTKPVDEQRSGMDEAALNQILQELQYLYGNYCSPLDRSLFVWVMNKCKSLEGDERLPQIEYISNHSTRSAAEFYDTAVTHSRLDDFSFASKLFFYNYEQLAALNDPFLSIAASLLPAIREDEIQQAVFEIDIRALRKSFMQALLEWKGNALYPDANQTLRFTWGRVSGYEPKDAVAYTPFSTLRGAVAKHTGKEPFAMPGSLLSLYRAGDFGKWYDKQLASVPLAFLTQCDITGGNSGSPVLNAKGELIGLAFDGNYEGLLSDWKYDVTLQRTIAVDIRYVLFITQKLAHADYLLREMRVLK